MAYLRNSNGTGYRIIGRRPSTTRQHFDYLVVSPYGQPIVAHGWDPKHKCWEQGDYYGYGEVAMRAATKDFYGKSKKSRKR